MIRKLYEDTLQILNAVSVILIFLTAIWIFGDVVGRFFFNSPIPGTTELVKTAILPIIFLGAPYTLRQGGHIRTTVLVRRFSPRARAVTGIVAALVGATVFLFVAIYGWEAAVKSFMVKEFEGVQLRVPTYPSRFVMVLGSVLLVVQFLLDAVNHIRSLNRGGAS